MKEETEFNKNSLSKEVFGYNYSLLSKSDKAIINKEFYRIRKTKQEIIYNNKSIEQLANNLNIKLC